MTVSASAASHANSGSSPVSRRRGRTTSSPEGSSAGMRDSRSEMVRSCARSVRRRPVFSNRSASLSPRSRETWEVSSPFCVRAALRSAVSAWVRSTTTSSTAPCSSRTVRSRSVSDSVV